MTTFLFKALLNLKMEGEEVSLRLKSLWVMTNSLCEEYIEPDLYAINVLDIFIASWLIERSLKLFNKLQSSGWPVQAEVAAG